MGEYIFPATWKVEICAFLQFRGPHCPIFFTWYFNVWLTQGFVTILHLLFLIIAGPVPQSDLEEFIRNWHLQEGCSFPSVSLGLVLTRTSGIQFARFDAGLEQASLCETWICSVCLWHFKFVFTFQSTQSVSDFDQKSVWISVQDMQLTFVQPLVSSLRFRRSFKIY